MATVFLRLTFKLLMILSVPTVMFGYWPNHYTPAVKLLFMEYFSMILGILGLFTERRRAILIFPALLLLISILNMFTHGLNAYTQTGVAYVFFFVLAFYTLSNFIDELDIKNLRSVLVWCAVVNSVFSVAQFFNYSPAMDYNYNNGSLPSGFMTYPCLSSLLAAVGLILISPCKKMLMIPLVLCLLLKPELSILVGLVIALLIKFYPSFKNEKYLIFSAVMATVGLISAACIYHTSIFNFIINKLNIRLDYWLGSFHYLWSRPLDGWGIGGWSYFVEKLFPQTPHNAWPELHNEPLQSFFELGLIGVLLFFFWAKRIIRKFSFDDYSLCLIVFLTASLGHAVLHFADGIWLFLIVYVLWEATRGTSDKTWKFS